MSLEQRWHQLLNEQDSFYIFGAGQKARETLLLIIRSGGESKVKAFVVSDKKENPTSIMGIEVVDASSISDRNSLILLGVGIRLQTSVLEYLRREGFTNVHVISEELNLNHRYESTVNTISLGELLKKQMENGKAIRYDLVANVLFVESYYGKLKNEIGDGFDARIENINGHVNSRKSFLTLIKSWEEYGYDPDSEILVSLDGKLIDGVRRIALAIYHRETFVKIRAVSSEKGKIFDKKWLEKHFLPMECLMIEENAKRIFDTGQYQYTYDIRRLNEECYLLLGKSQSLGKGGYYQSFPRLGIPGMRPSDKRIDIYGLKELITGKSVLDIGCYCGFFDFSLAECAQYIDGVEYSHILVKIAHKMQDYLHINNVHIQQADFNQYNTKKRYDVVLSFAVHWWIAMPPATYAKKIVSLLKKDGYLFIESQDLPRDYQLFAQYTSAFESMGFLLLKCGEICDDGFTKREFRLYSVPNDYRLT